MGDGIKGIRNKNLSLVELLLIYTLGDSGKFAEELIVSFFKNLI